MYSIKIGILKEGKIPIDNRVPLTPSDAQLLKIKYPEIDICCQASQIRCFNDEEYENAGIEIVDDLSSCDLILGIKEVSVKDLIPQKTYMFFSHTIKEQPYNRKLIQEIVKKRITLIDYECLTNQIGQRILAFGRFAGIVGAYNSILIIGKKFNYFNLKLAHKCFDYSDMQKEYLKVKLPPVKIVLTGRGKVGKGVIEVLEGMSIRRVDHQEFIYKEFNYPVYIRIIHQDYNERIDGLKFEKEDFYSNPTKYRSKFLKYAHSADILIAGAFWDPKAPPLFQRKDILDDEFKIKVVADITCDINGSIPSTKRSSSIDDPVYDYNANDDKVYPPFTNEHYITVMAVDNLPSELPVDASKYFSNILSTEVLPNYIKIDRQGIISGATITKNGELTANFKYLRDYVGSLE